MYNTKTNNDLIITKYDRNICNLFFDNQPNEICSHLREKVSKDRFLKSEMLQNYRNEGKGKEKKKERGEGKEAEEKKSNGCARSLYNSYSGDSFWRRKLNCWAQKVHSAITFLTIQFTISRS